MYYNFLKEIIYNPINSISIIFNLVLIDCLLSIDNAAILTTIVNKLNKEDREKTLKYGIYGAYLFRFFFFMFASVIINMWYLKLIGGIYLIYLGYNHFIDKKKPFFLRKNIFILNFIPKMWRTIFYVEIIDILFSIDNIFAGISYSNNTLLMFLGIFISLFIIRFSTKKILNLTKKYSSLENSAFIILILLGFKLIFSIYEIYYPDNYLTTFLQSKIVKILFSLTNISIFIIPILYYKYIKKN
ncbi:TerC family protein [Candidatus Karelsulcia muelleri]|uniref:Integral membrane protein TerC family n=1 Tax=Candidatus Karelsulcia muelleri PSPU TaxID=1189303 RepID=A0AAD1AZU6_9FLAO|nr:membrane protein [Candidatus Karelsulcia muelleri]NJJ98769.1 hypothetical protein [Candidatus Karelsulcia muelleri]BAO66421.1 integral membrane protein TerC family [Candidatus Karelsulcia muelleri PSPU]